jgi:hypothetical protein
MKILKFIWYKLKLHIVLEVATDLSHFQVEEMLA